MKTLKNFLEKNPHLELVKDKKLHKALHKVSPTWYVFISRMDKAVEVHDTAWLIGEDQFTSHVMTEPNVSWKIVHDAMKYNSKVFDAESFFEEDDKIVDENDKWEKLKRRELMKQQMREIMNGG